MVVKYSTLTGLIMYHKNPKMYRVFQKCSNCIEMSRLGFLCFLNSVFTYCEKDK